MKKFCSKCGAQLDLGKKSCPSCQAFNPYFIAGFTTTEDEPISIQEQTTSHLSVEQPIQQKENGAELKRLLHEQLEQKKNELELKNQLQKVQEETEQFKKETFNLVKDVQKELHGIEKENKLLKETVELLKNQPQIESAEPVVTSQSTIKQPAKSKKGLTAIAAVSLLIIATVISYSFFRTTGHKVTSEPTSIATHSVAPVLAKPVENKDTVSESVATDSVSKTQLLAVANVPAAPKVVTPTQPEASTPSSAATTPQPAKFSLSQSKLKEDLVGKKLSGCDVTIKSTSEINSIDNLVLVDKLSASYLKYKCRLKISQGGDVFTSTPYIYYSAEGTFIKVDGTNCE